MAMEEFARFFAQESECVGRKKNGLANDGWCERERECMIGIFICESLVHVLVE